MNYLNKNGNDFSYTGTPSASFETSAVRRLLRDSGMHNDLWESELIKLYTPPGGSHEVTKRRRLHDRRNLATTSITNPVMCVVAGDTVEFAVTSSTKNYPVYLESSLLNSNDNFDYGQFL